MKDGFFPTLGHSAFQEFCEHLLGIVLQESMDLVAGKHGYALQIDTYSPEDPLPLEARRGQSEQNNPYVGRATSGPTHLPPLVDHPGVVRAA